MKNGRRITLIQLNDLHGHTEPHQEWFWGPRGLVYRQAGGLGRIAAAVSRIRSAHPDALLLDGGDTLHGTAPTVRTQGRIMVPLMNALGVNAMTGHWDFAYGPDELRKRIAEMEYPFLAANVYDNATGARAFPPFTVVESGGFTVGIMGLASNIVDKTMPPHFSSGLRFTDGREELPILVDELRSRHRVDAVVLLSHLGFPQDMQLLQQVKGIDICLSSHTHNRLFAPARSGKTIVIQSGCHGSFIGRLTVELGEAGVRDFDHELIEIGAGMESDPRVEGLATEALLPFSQELDQIVGSTQIALNRANLLESTADNFLLEAIAKRAGTQLAFSNGWRFGPPVPPGPVRLKDLYNFVPMDPEISTVSLTGEEIRSMLEENIERTIACDAFRQMGGYVKRCHGLTVRFKVENPTGDRIQKIFAGEEPLDGSRSYTAAFITMQAVPDKYGSQRVNTGTHAIQAMRDHLQREHDPSLRGTFTPV